MTLRKKLTATAAGIALNAPFFATLYIALGG